MKVVAGVIASMALMLAAHSALADDQADIKTTFEHFVAAQNAHDLNAVRDVLADSPDFIWITRGTPIWGRDAALKRFDALYKGTWKLTPDLAQLKVIALSNTSAQLFVPITFNMGPSGQPAPDMPFLMNQTLVKTANGWRIASILPIVVPPAAPPPTH